MTGLRRKPAPPPSRGDAHDASLPFLSRRILILGLAAAGLSGCTGQVAGTDLPGADLGGATERNRLAMMGRDEAAGQIEGRFAASVPTVVTFPFDSAELTAQARAILDQQARFMLAFPEVRFSVYGHTDLVGPEGYNLDLGRRRARAAVRHLGTRGVDLARLDALVSFGEERPLVPTAGREPVNRRAVTEVAGFVAGHPTVLDGNYAQIVYRNYLARAGASGLAASAAE